MTLQLPPHPSKLGSRLGLASSLVIAFSSPLLATQSARDTVQVDPTTILSASGPACAVDGDRALIVYEHDGEMAATVSSNRGIAWSNPVRVDSDLTASFKFAGRNSAALPVALFDSRAHTLWRDTRNGDADLCYARSMDAGLTWDVEFMLDEGATPLGSPVRDFAFGASDVAVQDHIHVLFSLEPGSAGPEDLYLVSSLDGGTTFSPAKAVSEANQSGADVDQISLAVDGLALHMAWVDDRSGADDVYYKRSVDGGLSFVSSELKLDETSPAQGDAEDGVIVVADGNLVAVGWMEEIGSAKELALVAVSTNAGVNFASPIALGNFLPNAADVDELTLATADGVLFAAWADDRSGTQSVYVVRSDDAGATWSSDLPVSTSGGNTPRLMASPGFVTLTWVGSGIPGVSEVAQAVSTRDAGITWSDLLEVSTNSGDVDGLEAVIDPLYGNVITTWLADDLSGPGSNNVWAGGYRPQSFTQVGWAAGPSVGNFDFTGFSGNESLVWVIGSDTPGDLRPLLNGDPRSTGLTLDGTLLFTLEFPANFTALLGPDGKGSSVPFAVDLPAGTQIYSMASSIGLGPARLVEMTDVILISL